MGDSKFFGAFIESPRTLRVSDDEFPQYTGKYLLTKEGLRQVVNILQSDSEQIAQLRDWLDEHSEDPLFVEEK